MTKADDPSMSTDPNTVLFPPPREVQVKDPWADDLLDVQALAEQLERCAHALVQAHGGAVALDGAYGSGKTFLLERWIECQRAEGRMVVYYNAWENDDDVDPLCSLLEALGYVADKQQSKWFEGATVVLNQAVVAVTATTVGVPVNLLEASNAMEQPRPLDSRRMRREKINELRGRLVKLVRERNEGSGLPGIVVVVDEIDRCRPPFAIKLLERVKHILNVPGIAFVFGVNICVLRKSVRAEYGKIDVVRYLQRLFTKTLHMPDGAFFPADTGADCEKYLKRLVDRHELDASKWGTRMAKDWDNALALLKLLCNQGGYTPRELEKIVELLVWVAHHSYTLAGENKVYPMHARIAVLLAIASVRHPVAYQNMITRPNGAAAVIDAVTQEIDEAKLDDWMVGIIDELEVILYASCHQGYGRPLAHQAIEKLANGQTPTRRENEALSARARAMGKEGTEALAAKIEGGDVTMDKVWGAQLLNFTAMQGIASRMS